MITWFDMPANGLSNGGQFEIKELSVTENGTYEQSGEMYNKVTVNVEGGGGSSDFSTAEVTIIFSGATDVHPSYGVFSFDECEWTGDIPSVESSGSILSIPIPQGESTVLGGFIGLKNEEEVPMTFVSITGNGTHEIIDESEVYNITGDCTITIS